MAWHVAYTKPNGWRSALDALGELGCVAEVLAPSRAEHITLRGRTIERQIPWLGPLVLARWESNDPFVWHDVADLDPVIGIVGGWPPAQVPQHQVDRLLNEIQVIQSKAQVTAAPPCVTGAIVRFTHLAFYRLVARCVWINDDQVGLRLGILGRDAVIPVPWSAVERLNDGVDVPQYGRSRR